MRATYRILTAVATLVIVCGIAHADGPEASRVEEVRRAISTMWSEHIAAAVRKDADAVMKIYDEDCVYVVPGTVEARGHQAIREMETATLASNDVLSARHTVDALEVHGDVAYEIGTVSGPIRSGDAPPQVLTFHFMALWRRQADSGWKIAHMVGLPQAPDEQR